MISIALLGIFLVGYSFLNIFAKQFSIYERIGFSFIIGLGIIVCCMVLLQLANLPISFNTIALSLLLLIIGLNIKPILDKSIFNLVFKPEDKIQFSFSWFLFFGLIGYFLYGIITKGLYWPTAEYDSITGFELQGKMIANEQTMKTSIYEYPSKSSYDTSRFFYPPLTAAAFAFAFIFGAGNAKIMVILLFISFLITFYGLIRKSIKDTWAILITFFMMVTPEMFSHASLALTNLPNAIYTSLSFICLFYWLSTKDRAYFIVSLLLMTFTILSRSDSVVFIAGSGLVFLIDFIRTKEWKSGLIYCTVAIIPFITWSIFVKTVIGADSSEFFIKEIFFDGDKFTMIFGKCLTVILGNGLYYGITFYLFLVVLSINTVDVFQTRNPTAIFIISAWFMYTLLYYQLDYSFAGGVDAYINASYKRGMFNFVPLCWFFIATSPMTTRWLIKIDKFTGLEVTK